MYFVIFVPCYLCLSYGSEINLKVKVDNGRYNLNETTKTTNTPATTFENFIHTNNIYWHKDITEATQGRVFKL